MAEGQSRVLTLVFTDLADSTALKSERGDAVVRELMERHRDHVSELAQHCQGHIIDWAGDGCFLTFETSSASIKFALRLQQIHHYESELPGVRIGVHMGEVSVQPLKGTDRVEGLIVDLAARISGLARPGQVLISSAVQQSAKQRLGIHEFGQPIRWENYGSYTLKGFDESVDIREAGLESISVFEAPAASEKAWPVTQSPQSGVTDSGPAPIRKLAVLPLSNMSGDPNQEYFVDGMTEAITMELAKIKALRVISRTSVMRYKNTTQPLMDIAKELKVDGLIEGSVFRAGNEVRITAQLIRGDSDEHVWAENYDGNVEDILKLQKDIALAIADEVHVVLTADERTKLRTALRIDPEAYDIFLKAARFGGNWSPKSIQKSLDQFDVVAQLAPDFAGAYTMKGTANFMQGMWGYAPSTKSFSDSRKSARRALRLNDNDGGANTILGWLAMAIEWDWEEALYRFHLSKDINSSNQFIYGGLGILHTILGQYDVALESVKKGVECDPNNPAAHHNVGLVYLFQRNYPAALEKMADSRDVGQNALPPHLDGALVAACVGEHELARELYSVALELGGPQPHILAHTAYAQAQAGETAAAEEILEKLKNYSGKSFVMFMDLALINMALGHVEDALYALEQAQRDREYSVVLMGISPVYDPLRNEPRFQALIDEMDLPAS